MEWYVKQDILFGIYAYMTWNDLRMHKSVPHVLWANIIDHYCLDKTFRWGFNHYWENRVKDIPPKDSFLCYINFLLHEYYLWQNGKQQSRFNDVRVIPSLFQDKDFVLLLIQYCPKIFQCISLKLKADKDIMMKAVTTDGSLLKYAHDSLKINRDIVKAAVKKNGDALQYADINFRSDSEIVLLALANTKDKTSIVQYIDPKLFQNKDFFLQFKYHQTPWILDGKRMPRTIRFTFNT